jgi:subtilase family serine protease
VSLVIPSRINEVSFMLRRLQRGFSGAFVFSSLGVVAACSSGGGSPPSTSVSTGTASIAVFAHPPWATPQRLTGTVAADETIAIQVHLQLRNADGAAAELAAISDPDSAEYGRFLSDADFDARYGATDADVAAVRAHLEASGLEVTHVPGNRTFVAARGTAAQVGRAFSTRLGLYRVGNQMRRAPIEPPTVPAAIASRVLGVLGLTAPLQMKPRMVHTGGIRRDSIQPPGGPPKGIGGTGTCSEWYGALPDTEDPPYGPDYPPLTFAPCGYTPAQIRRAYGFDQSIRKGNDGTGESVAVVDAYLSPTLLSDVQTYAAQNDPDYPLKASQLATYEAPGVVTPPDPGWYVEQTLDVEAAHAIAPGAKIVAVAAQSQSDQDLIAGVNLVIEKKLATLVSNSYETQVEAGLTDALIWESLATQAGLKGVGLYFSSGDSGDDSFGGFEPPTISFPGSLATITSVGGTSLALGNVGQKLWETGWETGLSFLEYTYPVFPDDGGPGESEGGGGGPGAGTGEAGEPDDGGASDDGSSAPTADAGTASADAAAPPPPSSRGKALALDASTDSASYAWYPPAPGEFYFGSGGGVSILFPQPSYQVGIVPKKLADAPGVLSRVIPDVSMLGDPVTGFVIGQTPPGGVYEEYVVGGTSLSSPLFAGVMALAQQHAKHSFGFANTLLYKESTKGAFNDVRPLTSPQVVAVEPGVATTFDFELTTIHTTIGYDDVTGLGSPNGATFLAKVK